MTARRPRGAVLEIATYSDKETSSEFYGRFARFMIARTPLLQALGNRGPGLQLSAFVTPEDELPEIVAHDANELEAALGDPDVRVTHTWFESLYGPKGVAQILTYGPISDAAAAVGESHPVVLRSEASVVEFPIARSDPKRAEKVARTIVHFFADVCSHVRPLYAAITVEETMPSRYDLSERPSRGLANIFLDSSAGADALAALERCYEGSLVREHEHGTLFISQWPFAPLSPSGAVNSNQVAEILARAYSRPHAV
jgi:hypothetical protein